MSTHVQKIQDAQGVLLALVIRPGSDSGPSVEFFTDPEDPLQIGRLQHPLGRIIFPHRHLPQSRTVTGTSEALLLVRGRLQVDLYGTDGWEIQTEILQAGDAIVLLNGGHGFQVLEEVEIWEVRLGPYRGRQQDKTLIQG